jgi:lipopolysaccharide export system protein LptA
MMSRFWLLAAIVALAVPGAAAAESPVQGSAAQSPVQGAPAPSPLQGALQSQNKDQPIHIEAATLEVHDKAKTATFSGNVQVVQGDTTMRCRSLVVFYGAEEGAGTAKPAAARPVAEGPATPGMPQGAQSIRRIEARGGVTVVTKDQNASGELGVYDLKTKTITLTGNARVESGATAHDRVRALIQPGKGANGTPTNVMSFGQGHPN